MIKKIAAKKRTGQVTEWERLLSVQQVFQSRFPECVLVGGTAAAIHVGHRISLDADHVRTDLKKRFEAILKEIEKQAGWHTSKIEPPVLILGNFKGVRTGIRQLIRKAPLETVVVRGLRVPTEEEVLRIKGYLIVRRNTTRDYIDFVALFDHLGVRRALLALDSLDSLYPQPGETSMTQQLALQLSEPKPWDFSQVDLSHYRALQSPYTDWREVRRRATAAGQKILVTQLKV